MSTKNPHDIKVGSHLWVYEFSSGAKRNFERVKVESETRVSWVMANGQKVPKNHNDRFETKGFGGRRTVYFLSEQAAQDEYALSYGFAWRLASKINYPVRENISADTMRKIAELLGIDSKLTED